MKKTAACCLLAVFLFAALTCAAPADRAVWVKPDLAAPASQAASVARPGPIPAEIQEAAVFQLPASLRIIGDMAFEGTAVTVVDLPETVESIGVRSFADIPSLRGVSIPKATASIARDAFAGSAGVVITAMPGSYAGTWARENSVPLRTLAVLTAATGGTQSPSGMTARRLRTEEVPETSRSAASKTHQNPVWRAVRDIRSEQYSQRIANHILGRSPPALG